MGLKWPLLRTLKTKTKPHYTKTQLSEAKHQTHTVHVKKTQKNPKNNLITMKRKAESATLQAI